MKTHEIYNYRKVDDLTLTSGQPTEEQLRALAAQGCTTVINLAPVESDSSLKNEADIVRSLGMTYHNIPVDWENPKDSDFEAFELVMQQLPPKEKTLIHCIANFRVTAFFSLYALKYLGWSQEQASAFRASIWQGSDYPAWKKFVADMEARILS